MRKRGLQRAQILQSFCFIFFTAVFFEYATDVGEFRKQVVQTIQGELFVSSVRRLGRELIAGIFCERDLEFFVAPTELRFPKIFYALGEVAIEVLAVTA